MSVKNAVDYYNSSDIRIGDIVIIDDSCPQSCEGDQIAEPFTRLRIQTLEMEQYSGHGRIRTRLETEYDEIPLTHPVDLLSMGEEPLLYNADHWFKTTTTAYSLALKKSKIFGRLALKPGILFSVFITLWMLALFGIICWAAQPEIFHQQVSQTGCAVVLFITVVMVGSLFFGASTIERKPNAIGDARKQAAKLEKQLRLYRLANPNCTDVTAIDSERG